MRLFKTEMIFIQPPRTRFGYGHRASRLPRYGRRTQPAPSDAPLRIEPTVAAAEAEVAVERAA
jgi:hypothetical protein